MASVATAPSSRKAALLTIHKHELDESAKASPWRTAWREGFAPQFSARALEILARALADDDPRILQGATIDPPPLPALFKWPVEAADAITFCGWQGDGLETVGEAAQFFAETCFEADRLLGEPASVRWFLNWYDETPRDEMRRLLLAEVNRALQS